MTEHPPTESIADIRVVITDKAVRDFKRVLEQQTGKRWDADHANDNGDQKPIA